MGEHERIAGVVARVLGRRVKLSSGSVGEGEVGIKFVGHADKEVREGEFERHILVGVECAEGDTLGRFDADAEIMVCHMTHAHPILRRQNTNFTHAPQLQKQTAPFALTILTSCSHSPSTAYKTYMFAPLAGVPEDHV
jgi:hypothetical protein